MKELSLEEAERLAVYFEELSAHQYRERKEQESRMKENQGSSTHTGGGEVATELELGNAEEYDDPYWWKDDDEP